MYFVHGTVSAEVAEASGGTEELKTSLLQSFFNKNNVKNYNFSSFNMEVLTICKECN